VEELARKSVDPIDGIYELLALFKNLNLKLAVASASNLTYANIVLDHLKVYDYFLSIISGDMVTKGKPEPDIFLLAANRLNIDPEDCLVIEDGISGMIAANRAGMKCIGLIKNIDFNKYPTKNQILSLKDITKEYLLSL
jgi:HAD superfamily hydrolase (TIGR01509 family)